MEPAVESLDQDCLWEAGLQTTGQLRAGLDGETVALAAADRNVELTPLSRYARRTQCGQGLLFGFGALDEREIKRGVHDLAAALEQLARLPSSRACGKSKL